MHDTDATMITSLRSSRRLGGVVAQAVDLLVDERVLLDVGVARRDVRLRLIVVVVADEVLDGVVGEQLLELAVQLGRERLVGRQDQRGALPSARSRWRW
jgi:hypothetical protein